MSTYLYQSLASDQDERSFLDHFRPGLDDLRRARDAIMVQPPSSLKDGVREAAIQNYDIARKEAMRNALSSGAVLAGIATGLYFLSKRSR